MNRKVVAISSYSILSSSVGYLNGRKSYQLSLNYFCTIQLKSVSIWEKLLVIIFDLRNFFSGRIKNIVFLTKPRIVNKNISKCFKRFFLGVATNQIMLVIFIVHNCYLVRLLIRLCSFLSLLIQTVFGLDWVSSFNRLSYYS